MQRTKNGEFGWLDISAKDAGAQSAFYEALFGWAGTDVPYGDGLIYRMLKKDGHTVGGMTQLSPELLAAGAPSAWNTYLATADVDATVARALDLGATVAMPPMDVAGSGRMAAITDPVGAVIFFWKAIRPDESAEYSQPGLPSWTDLNTRDPEKSIAFYSALLGWDINQRPGEEYWVISVDGEGQGGIMRMPEMVPAEVPSYWMPYFGSADVSADTTRAATLGGTVLVEPTLVEETVMFSVITDPGGATFALMAPMM